MLHWQTVRPSAPKTKIRLSHCSTFEHCTRLVAFYWPNFSFCMQEKKLQLPKVGGFCYLLLLASDWIAINRLSHVLDSFGCITVVHFPLPGFWPRGSYHSKSSDNEQHQYLFVFAVVPAKKIPRSCSNSSRGNVNKLKLSGKFSGCLSGKTMIWQWQTSP